MTPTRKKQAPVDERPKDEVGRGSSTTVVITMKSGKKHTCKVVERAETLVLHESVDDPKLYDISHELSDCCVLAAMSLPVARRYLKYLVAGGLKWAFTHQPRNPEDANLPEVKRGIRLRDERRRVHRHLSQTELTFLLDNEVKV